MGRSCPQASRNANAISRLALLYHPISVNPPCLPATVQLLLCLFLFCVSLPSLLLYAFLSMSSFPFSLPFSLFKCFTYTVSASVLLNSFQLRFSISPLGTIHSLLESKSHTCSLNCLITIVNQNEPKVCYGNHGYCIYFPFFLTYPIFLTQ